MADDEARDGAGLDLMLQFGGPFPWHGTYRGEPVVLILAADYRALSGAPEPSRAPQTGCRAGGAPLRLTQWDRDPELAAFVRSRLGKVSQRQIVAEAVERFGEARAPTRSALNRFAVTWRLDRGRVLSRS